MPIRVTIVYEFDTPNAVVECLNNSDSKGMVSLNVVNTETKADDDGGSFT